MIIEHGHDFAMMLLGFAVLLNLDLPGLRLAWVVLVIGIATAALQLRAVWYVMIDD